MNTPPEESEYSKRLESIQRTQRLSRAIVRFILIGLAVYILPYLLLGIPFFMIIAGLFQATLFLSPIWAPAKRFVILIIGLPESESPFRSLNPSLWNRIWFIILSLPWLALAGFGVWILLKNGFLDLNPIYMIFFK